MIIVGAGSLGIQILDQLITNNYSNPIIFFDSNKMACLPNYLNHNYSIVHSKNELKSLGMLPGAICVAIGNSRIRKKVVEEFLSIGGELENVLSNDISLSNFCEIGLGIYIQPGCRIAHNVKIGDSTIIHANSIISHDVNIANYVSISQNVNIMKNVNIHEHCFIGANTVVMPGVEVGKNVYIEANSVVNRNLIDFETYSKYERF